VIAARDHERIAAAYATGMYMSVVALGAITCAATLHVILPQTPAWLLLVASASALSFPVFAARSLRVSIDDLVRNFSASERILAVLVVVFVFAAPSVFMRRWSPLSGLLAVQVPIAFLLVSEAGFSAYYLLCGLTVALTASKIPEPFSYVWLLPFGAALVVTMAYENFFFSIEGLRVATDAKVSLPLRAGLPSFALTLLATLPVALAVPALMPLRYRPAGTQPGSAVGAPQFEFEMSTIKLFLISVPLVFATLGLAALARWVYRRLRARKNTLLPETSGAPTGTAHSLQRKRRQRPPLNPRDPRSVFVQCYWKLNEALAKDGAARAPHQTPDEFARDLTARHVLNGTDVDAVTDGFVRARYSAERVTHADAESFRRLVGRIIDRQRHRHQDE
jgi:hypothetical protein